VKWTGFSLNETVAKCGKFEQFWALVVMKLVTKAYFNKIFKRFCH